MKNTFLNLPRRQKQLIAAITDAVSLPLIFSLAVALHLETLQGSAFTHLTWWALATSLFAIPTFALLGLYRAVVRYVDQKIIGTVVAGVTLSVLILAEIARQLQAPFLTPAVFVIYSVTAILYVLASRLIARGIFAGAHIGNDRRRVAIYGAGQGGSLLANALKPSREYNPILFVDDNPQRQNTTIGGIRVYSPVHLKRLAAQHNIDTVLLAMPSLSPDEQRLIVARLADLKLKIKITPPIADLLRGNAQVQDVREIEIDDLLGRNSVAPDPHLMSPCIAGKAVLISGAGGSIGSELCRQIILLKPSRLALLELSEFALYSIEQELKEIIATHQLEVELLPFVGSVLDYQKCQRIMTSLGIETVYHAAAYKHVPLVEHNPIEGIRNNVFGTLNFAKAAIAANVNCFILISTDKAVRPTNVMGATKRLAELILQAFTRQGSNTRFSMVRFGNVLGSSGSVVPLFRKQIAAGGPITLTHPEITRYFMTIPEAAQLVLQAGSMATGGDVFVLDMGEPVRIADLAQRMVQLSGQEVKSASSPQGNIEIRFIGLRPGEKLYEELLIGNNVSGTSHPLIMRAQETEIDWPFLEIMLKQLDEACDRMEHDTIRNQLMKMVREYRPNSPISDLLWLEQEPQELIETMRADTLA
jgi:FlaA1/EpsC-like NDP-sugar epimerase